VTRPPVLERAPKQLRTEGGWAFGRYRRPIVEPALGPGSFGRKLRVKEWHYHSIAGDDWFLGFALVQLGYVANAFVYLVDRATDEKLEYEAISPLGRALSFAPSSVLGETSWRSGQSRIQIGYDKGWNVELDVSLSGKRLSGEIRIEEQEALAVVFPLAADRPAYTHKAAGMPAQANLSLSGSRVVLSNALATLDWTRSLARRRTRWKWASFAGKSRDGRTIGLNLSSDVYDDPEGESHENAAWIDGVTHDLAGVCFELPSDPASEPWHIRSSSSDQVDLEFRPHGARRQTLNLGLIRSDFIQPFGTFHGRLSTPEPVRVDGAFGVVENHFALW